MKFLDLELMAYGPFTGVKLDFSSLPMGLHVIYGRNEAGKSTTLRAVRGLLYGIDPHTGDAHTHRMQDLRIGAHLADGAGEALYVVRRKGNKNTLLDAEERPIDEAALQRMLHHVGPQQFATLFGLDHETLRRGAEALLHGGGDVGESLFEAGLGGAGLHELVTSLRAEADALYTPQARNRPLNVALKTFEEAKREIKNNASLDPEAWVKQKDGIVQAQGELATLEEELTHCRREQSRLRRARGCLEPLERRRELRARRAALGEVILLGESAARDRQEAQRSLAEATQAVERLRGELATLASARAQVVVPEALLAEQPRLDRLREQLAVLRKAGIDLPRVRGELATLEADAQAILGELGRDAALVEGELPRIDAATQARVQKLAQRQEGLERRLADASAQLTDHEARLRAAQARLPALGGSERSLAELVALPLPGGETIARHEQAWTRRERQEEQLAEAERKLAERAEASARQIAALEREARVPTEEALEQARATRDRAWRALRHAEKPAPATLDAYETEVRRADELADRLRREAHAVAELQRLHAERTTDAAQAERLAAERARLAAERAEAEQSWRAAWADAAVTPLSPAEMRGWCERHARVVELADEHDRAARERAQAERELAAWREAWAPAVEALGLGATATAEEALEQLGRHAALVQKLEAAAVHRRRVEGMERDAARFAGEAAALATALSPELAELPAPELADRLLARLRDGLEAKSSARHLDAQRDDLTRRLDEEERRRARTTAQLEALREAARASDLATLERREAQSAEARELDRGIAAAEAELRAAGEGVTIATLEAELTGLDADVLAGEIDQVEAELTTLEESRRQLIHRIGGLEQALAEWESNDRGAAAAADAQEALARARALASRYLVVRTSVALLAREIERYRKENQGPIVTRASELFRRLTIDKYAGVKVGFDERDQAVLRCVRDGAEVPVEGLSDGTRDQLYLALRLASLERYAAAGEPMPLVVDDILIHFDDDRARAGLEVLGELSDRMQVLFFTHHTRLVELAHSTIPISRLREHQLP